MFIRGVVKQVTSILHAYSQILLQRHTGCGALLVFAIGLNDLMQLACSLSGVLGAHLVVANTDRVYQGLQGYNGTLIGLALPALGVEAMLALPLSLLGGALSVLLLQGIGNRLPPLTAPFVLIMLVTAPLLQWQGMLPTPAEAAPKGASWLLIPLWSIGQILFLDAPAAVVCCIIALLLASPVGLAWALAGALLGSTFAHLTGCDENAVAAGLFGFNAALAALTLGTVFQESWRITLMGTLTASALHAAVAWSGATVFTAPFILSVWLFRNLGARPLQPA